MQILHARTFAGAAELSRRLTAKRRMLGAHLSSKSMLGDSQKVRGDVSLTRGSHAPRTRGQLLRPTYRPDGGQALPHFSQALVPHTRGLSMKLESTASQASQGGAFTARQQAWQCWTPCARTVHMRPGQSQRNRCLHLVCLNSTSGERSTAEAVPDDKAARGEPEASVQAVASNSSGNNSQQANSEATTKGSNEPSTEILSKPWTSLPLEPKQMGVLVTTWQRRAASFTRESALLIYSALIDNTLVVLLERLQLDKLLRKAQPWLESTSARVFGSYHELASGERIPLSLVNNTGPDFSVPAHYKPAELPFGQPRNAGYSHQIAHFMSLCMRVVYEEPEVIQDLAERHWGLRYHGYFKTQTEASSLYDIENQNTADFIPRTRACMLSSAHGIVIAFRGSEPLNLINLRSSGKITMRPRFDMGRVHDGFHAGLFFTDVEQGSLYTQLVEALQVVDGANRQPIFLSGHSLGGALAVVFAAALQSRHPELAQRISGVYTFGMPRVGDADFCRSMDKAFPECIFRITHAADIIPLVPPRFLEYTHMGEEHYITSLGREVCGCEAIRKARRIETFGFLPLYFWKVVAGLLLNPKEGSLRTVYRLAMLVSFPGLNDHFPADYTYKLGRLLEK